MSIFNDRDLATLRDRAKRYPEIFDKIDRDTAELRECLTIPDKAYSTWGHYYNCPKHGVKFIFNPRDSKNFVCPIDNEVYHGEPYEGGWWTSNNYRNSAAAATLAIAYAATEKAEFLDTVKAILLGYAKNFPNYEEHGDIPYNKQGRLNSQVLCDSNQVFDFITAYALTKDTFTESERSTIENDFFIPETELIMKNFTPQLHNHEIAICRTVGSVGLVLGRRDFCEFAVNGKYGIKYQLDNSLLSDGFWFEGSTTYHFYVLDMLFAYERVAKHTEYSLMKFPHYKELIRKMLLFPFNITSDGDSLPPLNDTTGIYKLSQKADLYEHAYSLYGEEKFLIPIYKNLAGKGDCAPRFDTLLGLMCGTETLPQTPAGETTENYLSEESSGLAILHGHDERYLVLKATPYGGEHDHYDRLSVSFDAFGKPICADFGTVQYGVPLHYSYYKNTATHNTVCINGKNMVPCEIAIDDISIIDGGYILDAKTNSPEGYKMPDSFTIKAWDDEAYRGVSMRRRIIWQDKYFIDVFNVNSDNTYRKEWTWHTIGCIDIPEGAHEISAVAQDGAQSLLRDAKLYTAQGFTKISHDCGDGIKLDVHVFADGKELIFAKGHASPPSTDASFIIERTCEKSPIYINVIEAYREGEGVIESVDAKYCCGELTVAVTECGGATREFKLRDN